MNMRKKISCDFLFFKKKKSYCAFKLLNNHLVFVMHNESNQSMIEINKKQYNYNCDLCIIYLLLSLFKNKIFF